MSAPSPREQFLVINVLGKDAMELTNSLCRHAHESRCAVVSSRLSRHGELSALVVQVSGSWDALARLENILPAVAKKADCILSMERTTQAEMRPESLPYVAYVSASYRPDILNELCQFFLNHQVALESMTFETYQAPQTGSTMVNATLTLVLPPSTQISWLRDQFLDFADALNLDALIEPWRPQAQ